MPANYNIDELLNLLIDQKGSDLHLHVNNPPIIRVNGTLIPLESAAPLTPQDTAELMTAITSEAHQVALKTRGSVDFGFGYAENRFRINVYKSRGNYELVLRLIPAALQPLDQLGFPDVNIIKNLLLRPRGLILVTGLNGSGKTTTLAAMINWINENLDKHILTVEDPIEYTHAPKKSIVTQRELGTDLPSFEEGVMRGLRQDLNIVMIGELRNLETIQAAVTAAETGYLVFASLHTMGAANTVDRILNAFPSDAQNQIRIQLSASLLAAISQTLCKRADGQGRLAAYEIMVKTSSISALIRDSNTYRITSDIQTGGKYGMITLDDHLLKLCSENLITADEALLKAQSPEALGRRIAELNPKARK
jgi:twitching motility protein PilT